MGSYEIYTDSAESSFINPVAARGPEWYQHALRTFDEALKTSFLMSLADAVETV